MADSRSGLFLAAPRRTGKSTFLREDMLPAMQKRGWTTIYVDLWADKSKDPALLITSAVKAKIGTFAGVIAKLQPEAVQVTTPTGTIGVRGTQFLLKVEE